MIRRRLVVERITNPYSYTRFSTETIISDATDISCPNLCWYVMCVGNTRTWEMVAPRHLVANSGVLVWCMRFSFYSTGGRSKVKWGKVSSI